MKVNIGCGRDYREGWFNVDISRVTRADAYLDIGKDTVPIIDAEHILISGVLEQIESNTEFLHAMNECWRILRTGGTILIHVPNALHQNAFKDPFDRRFFTEKTWEYLISGTHEYSLYGSVYGFKPWEKLSIKTNDNGILCINLRK